MNGKIFYLWLFVLLAGCISTQIEYGGASLKRTDFMFNAKFGSVDITSTKCFKNMTCAMTHIVLNGYENDASVANQMVGVAISAAVKAAKTP